MDALGPSVWYQAYLSSLFPTLSITVTPKADSIYTIVGAASVAAKVTRDAWIEGWVYEETRPCQAIDSVENPKCDPLSSEEVVMRGSDAPLGSGYPSGKCQSYHARIVLPLTASSKIPKHKPG